MRIFLNDPDTRRRWLALLALLFVVSLAVRLAVAIPVIRADVSLRGDEKGYYRRANAAVEIIRDLASGKDISSSSIDALYGKGRWPPLHPVSLAIGMVLFDDSRGTARLVVVVLSALTTLVVYALTARRFDHRSGLVATGIHILYPGFVGFAHLLWSETTFILFLLLGLYLLVCYQGAEGRQRAIFALLSGVAFGLAGLTRPTVIVFLLLVPLWIAMNEKQWRQRLLMPALMLVAAIIVISPWQAWIIREEGEFHLLATTGALNMFRRFGPGDVFQEDIVQIAKETSQDVDILFREAALDSIRNDPVRAVRTGLSSAVSIWRVEAHLLSLFLKAIYPPVPPFLLGTGLLVTMVCYLALLTLAGVGIRLTLVPPKSITNLILLAVLAHSSFPLIMTGGNERLTIVNLALLTPLAGAGLVHRRELAGIKARIPSLAAIAALPVLALGVSLDQSYTTTTYYAPALHVITQLTGKSVRARDEVDLRAPETMIGETVEIVPLGGGYFVNWQAEDHIVRGEPGSMLTWTITPEEQQVQFVMYSADAAQRSTVRLELLSSGESVVVDPVTPATWQRWQPTGLDKLEMHWSPQDRSIILATTEDVDSD